MGSSCTRLKTLDVLLAKIPRLSEKNTVLWESVINVVMVHLGGQKDYTIESFRYEYNGQAWLKKWTTLHSFIRELNLVIEYDSFSLDHYPRYIVSRHQNIIQKVKRARPYHALNHINVKDATGLTLRVYTSTDDEKKTTALSKKWQRLWDVHTNRHGGFIFYCEHHK